MVHIALFLIFSFQLSSRANNVEICKRPEAEQKDLIACSRNFEIHSCRQLIDQNVELKYLNSCGLYDDQKLEPKSQFPILEACGKGLAQQFEALKKLIKKPYVWMKSWTPANYQCTAKLSSRLEEFHEAAEQKHARLKDKNPALYKKKIDEYMRIAGGAIVRGCTLEQQLKTNLLNLPSKEELQEAFDYVFRSAHCLNGEGRTKMLCPAILEIVAGVTTGPALRALKGAGTNIKLLASASRKLENAEDRIEKFKTGTRPVKEVASLSHQDDLLAFTNSARMKSRLERLDIDMVSLRHGMVDSDLGKLAEIESHYFRKINSDSKELFEVLQGKGTSPASRYFKEIMNESGFSGKTLLNPTKSHEQLVAALEANPGLRGYLHELPGMHQAIKDLNSGAISSEQFKNRIKANLFHNGPNEGFWKILSESSVPDGLKKTGHADFFEGTVFSEGKYPGVLSKEAVVHTLVDRLSQGTRGGLDKIFKEIGGNDLNKSLVSGSLTKPLGEVGFPPQKGVHVIEDLISGNYGRTKSQVEALKAHVSTMTNLSDLQRTDLSKMIDEALERLAAQNKELNKMIRFNKTGNTSSINIEYVDEAGNRVFHTITDQSTSGSALEQLAAVFKAEERINGDPIVDFSLGNYQGKKIMNKLTAYAGVVCGSLHIVTPASKTETPIAR